jgi:hypothetical protein
MSTKNGFSQPLTTFERSYKIWYMLGVNGGVELPFESCNKAILHCQYHMVWIPLEKVG